MIAMNPIKGWLYTMLYGTRTVCGLPFASSSGFKLQQTRAANGIQRLQLNKVAEIEIVNYINTILMIKNMKITLKYIQQLYLVAVIRRLIWLAITPLYIVNIVVGTLIVFPYWILTGKHYYDAKAFKKVMEWISCVNPNGL